MRVKPKDIQVNLPIVLMFDEDYEIVEFARTINTIIHGKVKVKCDNLGNIQDQCVGIFYLQRNNEYMSLRSEFLELIREIECNDGKDPLEDCKGTQI